MLYYSYNNKEPQKPYSNYYGPYIKPQKLRLHLGQANLWICSYAILWLSFEAVDFRMSSKGSVLVAVRILSGFWVY